MNIWMKLILLLSCMLGAVGIFQNKNDGTTLSNDTASDALVLEIEDNFLLFDHELKDSVAPAKIMLEKLLGSATPFSETSNQDIAKKLNYIVFNHCSSSKPKTGLVDINELFEVCKTSCGGYAYVLRGLLAANNINSRYVNLYNLPNQGNHTVVEAEIEPGIWALFDPTFGSFFTEESQADNRPLSLEEIRFLFTSENINEHVLTAKKNTAVSIKKDTRYLYERSSFPHRFMKVNNYLAAESISPVGLGMSIPLVLELDVASGRATAGILEETNIQEGQTKFLKWSNDTINNENPADDTSYLFHIVGNYDPYFKSLNVIRLINLQIGATYEIEFHGVSPAQERIQIIDIGRDLQLNQIEPEEVGSGQMLLKRKFRALASHGEIIFSVIEQNKSRVYLFGISVLNTKLRKE